MAIVQVSRITVRKGRQENLPQLAGAEFGWALDSQRLFIGNGLVADGAPIPGNTEILTEHSITNLLQITGLYSYRGERAGYVAQTGPTASPLTRTLQEKLDEYVSVLDFGAVGDGSNDDTAAINRALEQLFCVQSNARIRRALYFPAGVYLISGDRMKIPPYAIIYGDGPDSSTIRQIDDTQDRVAELVDSKFQSLANIGLGGATAPTNIVIRDITFENINAKDTFLVNAASHVHFSRVHFKGKFTAPSTPIVADEAIAAVRLEQLGSLYKPTNITFDQCKFSNSIRGLVIDDDCGGVVVTNSYFHDLYHGMRIGQNTLPGSFGGTNLRVTNSLFDVVYAQGILVEGVPSVVSSFNQFRNVGKYNLTNPVVPAVQFDNDSCASVFDYFERADTTSIKNVSFGLNTRGCSTMTLDDGMRLGWYNVKPGEYATLNDNTPPWEFVGGAAIGDVAVLKSGKIKYQIDRASNHRVGVMSFAIVDGGTDIVWDDEYSEFNPVDVTLAMAIIGTDVMLEYSTANTGQDAYIKYSLQTFE